MVKDQDSANVRVWVNGTEDNTTFFPDFTGGHLVVLANPNATFSKVKLTNTTVDLGIDSFLDNFSHVNVATIQAANPFTQQNVDDYATSNIILQNELLRTNPTMNYSSAGYKVKVGATQYYQILPFNTPENVRQSLIRYGNGVIGVDLILGGSGDMTTFAGKFTNILYPPDKSVTLSLKYYSKDVAYLRERLTVTGVGSPTVGFADLSPATQGLLIEGYKASLPSGSTVPTDVELTAVFTQEFAGYSLLQSIFAIAYSSRPLQSATEFINSSPGAVLTQTNPSGDFTSQNIESYKQISNKLDDTEYLPNGANITLTTTDIFATAQSVKTSLLNGYRVFMPYAIADIVPSVLITNSWILNTLDPVSLQGVISNQASFPTYDDFSGVGLQSFADRFVPLVGGQTNFNLLSYKSFAETFTLQTATSGIGITFNDLNGGYTIDMNNLLTGDEQKFRQALAMKESADVETALNIPESERFFYIVFGSSPNSSTNAVSWNYIPTIRDNNNVWSYVRVIDRNFGIYLDADTRNESSLTFYENTTNIPANVISAFNTFYSFTLNDNSLIGDKYLVRYTGIVEYYIYANMTTTVPTLYVLFSPLDSTITNDADRTWLDSIAFTKMFYQQFGQTPPPDDKLNYKVYKTWTEVETRLIDLTYFDKPTTTILTNDNMPGLNKNNYDLLAVSGDGNTYAYARAQYKASTPGTQEVYVVKSNVKTTITLPTSGSISQFGTGRQLGKLTLNNDGTVLLIGDAFDGQLLAGEILIYRYDISSDSWGQAQTVNGVVPFSLLGAYAGTDMNYNGDVIVSGAYNFALPIAEVRVVRWNPTTSQYEEDNLPTTPSSITYSVPISISPDGNSFAIWSNKVVIYRYSGGVWSIQEIDKPFMTRVNSIEFNDNTLIVPDGNTMKFYNNITENTTTLTPIRTIDNVIKYRGNSTSIVLELGNQNTQKIDLKYYNTSDNWTTLSAVNELVCSTEQIPIKKSATLNDIVLDNSNNAYLLIELNNTANNNETTCITKWDVVTT